MSKVATMKDVISATCSSEAEEKLFRAVIRQFGNWKDFFRYTEDYRDASAGVSGFIYYDETMKFAKANIEEITAIIYRYEEETGAPLNRPTGDTGAYETTFFNWLAWFALEYVADLVIRYKED